MLKAGSKTHGRKHRPDSKLEHAIGLFSPGIKIIRISRELLYQLVSDGCIIKIEDCTIGSAECADL